jgi:DNA-binding MarR family transcriptional regulator
MMRHLMVQRLRLRNLSNPQRDTIEQGKDGRLFDPAVRESIALLGSRRDVEPLEALAALRLAAHRMHSAMERWTESHGLSESRLRLLMVLYFSPDRRRPLGELAEMLDVVPRTVTDLVDVLERDGLIRRIPDSADRRSVHAQLTRAGTKRVEAIRRDTVLQQTALFASFDREQLADLRHLCLLLVRYLNQTRGGS